MMITIHGLPPSTKYADLKILIKQKCNITDFILDSLMNDTDGFKKVRVGLADDSEGSHLLKCLDGYRLTGHVLRLVPVAKSSQINAPQTNTYEMRDGYQQRSDYPNQVHDRGGRQMDANPVSWAPSNQWNPNQPSPSQVPANYGYQQQARNPTYGHQISQPVKQFEQRETIPTGHRPQNQGFSYPQKSNLINLGPQRNVQPAPLREVPEVSGRPIQGNRYPPQQNYDMPEKPITIMKDNFQGPTQYNIHPGHNPVQANYQPSTQSTPWSSQSKPFEKTMLAYEKKPYDDRKYPPSTQVKPVAEMSKIETYKNREFSPARRERYRREISAERSLSSPGRIIAHSGRISPGRQIYPASPDRRISPSGRQVYMEGQSSVSGRRVSPGLGRRVSPGPGLRIPPGQVRRVSPGPGRRVSPGPGRRVSPGPGLRIPPGQVRRVSPGQGRRGSPGPGHRVSPGTARRVSPGPGIRIPTGQVRRVSPGQGRRGSSGPGHRVSPVPGRRVSPGPGLRIPPGQVRRVSPGQGRRGSPGAGRRVSPGPGRRVSPGPGRRVSPGPGRIISPVPTRRISPGSGHRVSPGPGRRVSPGPGRRVSPGPGRRISSERRISPSSRHVQVDRRMPGHPTGSDRESMRIPPQRRLESPRRQAMRYSPTHHHTEKSMDFPDNRQGVKNVRPAYEPPQASNEAKYSGGYRPNVNMDTQYPARIQDQRWQDKDPSRKVISEDRRETRLQKFDIARVSEQSRITEQEARSRSNNRSSRSPRRDRSPVRDRYKRHSRSPRSPRRSWALEKRRSPDTREPPPPPIWPGQDSKNSEYQHHNRSKFTEREHDKTSPWESTHDTKREDFIRQRNADREHFEEEMRRRQTEGKWKPLPPTSPQGVSSRYDDDDRITREEKFSRKDFEEQRDFDIHEDSIGKQSVERRDKELSRQELSMTSRYKSEFEIKEGKHKSEKFSGLEEKKKEILKKQEQLQKEIDEVYKRAIDFTKKAELYKKGALKKSYHDSRRHADLDSEESDDYYEEYSHKDRKQYLKGHFLKDEDKDYETSIDRRQKTPPAKSKRNTAIKQIAEKIMSKYGSHLPSDLKHRVFVELQLSVAKILTRMFGKEDVAFIELVIKFNSKHTPDDEENIFDAVMSSFPTQYRRPKRSAKDESNIPTKSARLSGQPDLTKDEQISVNEPISEMNLLPKPAMDVPIPMGQIAPSGIIMGAPMMVSLPTQYQFVPTQMYQENLESMVSQETKKDGHSLYLCKDDFQPIEDYETTELKNFLVKKLIDVTQTSQGWAPDFTLSKQNSGYRHEMVTRDKRSRDWLLGLDFSEFLHFNVLVYTTEELWYERAAIWLPGHSRYRNIEPLTKLKLQNKQLEGINIGKWKFVKKIINEKGTRVYVDMPPSSARALEKHKMQLSYELQKVNVFLKAIAIDKEAFDAGLNERSIDYVPVPGLTPMPSILDHDKNIVKIAFKGNKPLSLVLARKVKDTIIYKMYKYHQLDGKSRTDYIKYGYCQPGYFCLLPENKDSKKWICNLDLGKINRIPLIIMGTNEGKIRYFNMNIIMPRENLTMLPKLVLERLRKSNQGVKGLNINLWKNPKYQNDRKRKEEVLNVDMDLESIDTISSMKYKLDLVVESREYTVVVDSNIHRLKLEDMIARYKAESSDKYDVANMDIASNSDEEIICLD